MRNTLFFLLLILSSILFFLANLDRPVRAQNPVTVRMPGADRAGIVAPKSLAVIEGIPIETFAASPVEGELELDGFRVQLDSQDCRITHVGPEGIVFIVAESVQPSFAGRLPRTLLVQGPTVVRFIDVLVVPFLPILVSQGGFAVATAALMTPVLYVGEPIPLSITGSNYITLRTAGILTGRNPTEPPFEPAVVLEREGEHYQLPGHVYPLAGWPTGEIVAFFAPACLSGEYQAAIAFGGSVSNRARIQFSSDCSSPVAITAPRQVRPRGPIGIR